MHTLIKNLLNGQSVEWKTLGEVAEIGTGNSNRQDEDENGEYPFYVRSKNILRSNTYQFDETAIIIPGEGGIGDIFHFVEGKYALHQRAYRICLNNDDINPKFLFYFMNNCFKNYIIAKSVGATATSIRKPMLEKFPIPIPSLEIQEKIVKILDKLTKLTAELTAEHALRKKQCQYYRDFLLDCDNPKNPLLKGLKVEWKTLGEVAEIYGGLTGKSKNDFENGNAKYISYKNIFDNIEVNLSTLDKVNVSENEKQHLVKYGDVLFTGSSETANEAGMSSAVTTKFDENIYLNSFSFGIRFNEGVCIIPEFSKHLFRSHFMRLEIAKTASGVTRFNISKARFKKIKIPIPPLETQAQIVAILDKFDTLTHSISEGLPREIELRQKQYEYYRELLLDFNMES